MGLAHNPRVAPARVLPGQPNDQIHRHHGQAPPDPPGPRDSFSDGPHQLPAAAPTSPVRSQETPASDPWAPSWPTAPAPRPPRRGVSNTTDRASQHRKLMSRHRELTVAGGRRRNHIRSKTPSATPRPSDDQKAQRWHQHDAESSDRDRAWSPPPP
jgi:hypothetical protein